jgi:hypothetical protein
MGTPACRLLLVFGDSDRRAAALALVLALEPECCVEVAASATDAVLSMLGYPADIVFVDADAAGDLLHSLVRHIHRAAPGAHVAVFGAQPGLRMFAYGRWRVEVLSWAALAPTLAQVLSSALGSSSPPRSHDL